jgi:hypothetical protein
MGALGGAYQSCLNALRCLACALRLGVRRRKNDWRRWNKKMDRRHP